MRQDRIVLTDDHPIIRQGISPLLVASNFDSPLASKPSKPQTRGKCTIIGWWTSSPTLSWCRPRVFFFANHVVIFLLGATSPCTAISLP